MTSKIAVILPPREGFSPQAFGAVSLSLRDFTLHSALRESIHIYGGRNEPPFADINYHACDVSRPWYMRARVRYLRALKRELSALKPSLIEVHNRPILALKIAAWKLAPVSLFLHNDPCDMEAANTPAKRAKLQTELVGILHVSQHIQRCFQEGIIAAGRHVVCPLGIALPTTSSTKKNEIVFVGRMVPEKGVHMFAEALVQTLPQLPDWRGVFVGGKHFATGALSPYEQQAHTILLPVWSQIDWRGFQDHTNTMQAFADAAIAVIPSLWEEPFGRIAMEAMAHGCAVITSARGGLAEIVGRDALVPSPFTAETLASAILALTRDSTLRSLMQQQAIKRATQFDITLAARHLDTVRTQLMQHTTT